MGGRVSKINWGCAMSGPCDPRLDDKRLCSLWSAGSLGTSLPSSSWPLLSRSCQGLPIVPCLFCWDQRLSAEAIEEGSSKCLMHCPYSLTSLGQGHSRRDGKNRDSKPITLDQMAILSIGRLTDVEWALTVLGTTVGVDFRFPPFKMWDNTLCPFTSSSLKSIALSSDSKLLSISTNVLMSGTMAGLSPALWILRYHLGSFRVSAVSIPAMGVTICTCTCLGLLSCY